MDSRDDDLSTLLHDAVSDVEPTDRLVEIRQATANRPRHVGWSATGAVALLAAAAVAAIAISIQSTPKAPEDSGPVSVPTATDTGEPTATPDNTMAAGIYFVGDTSKGPRLFREFQRVAKRDPLQGPLVHLTQSPLDPDYRTLWPAGSLVSAGFDGIGEDGFFSVTLSDAGLASRPDGMSEDEARLAIQSVVYTLQGATETLARVEFYAPGATKPLGTVLGVEADRDPDHSGVRSFDRDAQLDVLSWMSISNPTEGRTIEGSFTAEGVASSNEGNVPWELLDADGTVVDSGQTIAGMDDHLIPWKTRIDVSDLEPGSYTFTATTDDGAFTDTRTVVVE